MQGQTKFIVRNRCNSDMLILAEDNGLGYGDNKLHSLGDKGCKWWAGVGQGYMLPPLCLLPNPKCLVYWDCLCSNWVTPKESAGAYRLLQV